MYALKNHKLFYMWVVGGRDMEGFCVFSSTYNLQKIHDNWEIDSLQLLPKNM